MTTRERNALVLESIIELLELSASAYEKARERYEDLGAWFGRKESRVKDADPHIFPQGSFRLGTAIRPLDDKEEYDLDLACKLRNGFSKVSCTQQFLKNTIGEEAEKYRIARGIKSPLEEKHRCWRLEYQDDLSFHMDILPCIPADDLRRIKILASIQEAGEAASIADAASRLTVSITDDRHPGYRSICDDWNISNPEGYAKWFEARMAIPTRILALAEAQIDDVPIYRKKTPLQRVVQLLKRHRDQMFKDDPEVKPISMILTTLASRAYQGEGSIDSALANVLARMGSLVNKRKPRVPNPVDPAEDFADRWGMPKYAHLRLEENFWRWLQQAQSDFSLFGSRPEPVFLAEQARRKLSVNLDSDAIGRAIGVTTGPSIVIPKTHSISSPARPWSKRGN